MTSRFMLLSVVLLSGSVSASTESQHRLRVGPPVLILGDQYHLATCVGLAGHGPTTVSPANKLRIGIGTGDVCGPTQVDPIAGMFTADASIRGANQSEEPPQTPGVPDRAFSSGAGMLFAQVRRGREGDFEQIVADLKQALESDPDRARRQQATGFTVYRVFEPMQGNTLYLFIFEPRVWGQDYDIVSLIEDKLGARQRFISTIAANMNVLNLGQVLDMDPRVLTLSPSTATPSLGTQSAVMIPEVAEATPRIRSKCAADWPDDFEMRAYCGKQQFDALEKLRTRSMTSRDQVTIRNKCAKDWPDDFQMQDYCEEKQLKALASIR